MKMNRREALKVAAGAMLSPLVPASEKTKDEICLEFDSLGHLVKPGVKSDQDLLCVCYFASKDVSKEEGFQGLSSPIFGWTREIIKSTKPQE